MPRGLTEQHLEEALSKHAEECARCVHGHGACKEALEIEANFWDEVNRRVDEIREGGWS